MWLYGSILNKSIEKQQIRTKKTTTTKTTIRTKNNKEKPKLLNNKKKNNNKLRSTFHPYFELCRSLLRK